MYTVCMYVDELASLSSTPESEYEDIERDLRKSIFGDMFVVFKTDVLPVNLLPNTTIYVIDFGALSCNFMDYKADYISRQLITAIEDNPGTYFILWSSFTVRHYQYIACADKGLDCLTDLNKPANVFLWDSYSIKDNERQLDKIRQLLSLPEIIEQPNIARRSENGILSSDEEVD